MTSNSQTLDNAIARASAGQDLEQPVVQKLIDQMLRGDVDPEKVGSLLLALRAKGESVDEIAGAALAMRQHMLPIRTCATAILDTCGTGGDGSKTFNISTAAAIVAAAAGATVAKHGNRKITSATGSADVLTELGIEVEAPREVVERCLDDLGIGFCFAPKLHPAMKHVGEVRRRLGVPTLFNLLGPLCNPAGATHQVLGVAKAELQRTLAEALLRLPVHRAFVVRGDDGVDEVSLQGETTVLEVVPQGPNAGITMHRWNPTMFGLLEADRESMLVDTPTESAELIRRILKGEKGPPRDIVLLNAATGLLVLGIESDPKSAVTRTAKAIDSGKAADLLAELGRLSHLPGK